MNNKNKPNKQKTKENELTKMGYRFRQRIFNRRDKMVNWNYL